MIFVTIGTQEPFDRLIKAMDEIAFFLKDTEVIAQVFQTDLEIKNMKVLQFIPPNDFKSYLNNAQMIISHAGMGTIISALVQNKPIIVMPRLMKFNEHRNEHQLATASKLDELGYIHVVYDENDLKDFFFKIWAKDLKPLHAIGPVASDELIASIKDFI